MGSLIGELEERRAAVQARVDELERPIVVLTSIRQLGLVVDRLGGSPVMSSAVRGWAVA
ncbi:hypothetical protein SSP531S_59810 [Streptomyces spongiicola]|uniref:Uncharacterized protein n=1 Tax=Streptomyces spongiicola TaxID=1690221 RepID=A0A388T6B4_9ACTN|nr:hypothetical protein SSP531S_59810 [Streptomyces spongiicola]